MNNQEGTALVQQSQELATKSISPAQVELIKKTLMPGSSDDELQYFINVCNHAGLDPFQRQVFAVKRKAKVGERYVEKYEVQISIDGLRVLAERTGMYDGQDEAEWCDSDGNWRDIWLSKEPPAAARVKVYKKGISRPFVGIALYKEFVQTFGEGGKPGTMWAKMPANQLAKCAEAQAFRKASFRHDFAHLTIRTSEYEYDEPENESGHSQALLRKPEGEMPPAQVDVCAELEKAQADLARAKSGALKADASARIARFTKAIQEQPIEGEIVEVAPEPDAEVIEEIRNNLRQLGAKNLAESKTLIARTLGLSEATLTVEDLSPEQADQLLKRLVDQLST